MKEIMGEASCSPSQVVVDEELVDQDPVASCFPVLTENYYIIIILGKWGTNKIFYGAYLNII